MGRYIAPLLFATGMALGACSSGEPGPTVPEFPLATTMPEAPPASAAPSTEPLEHESSSAERDEDFATALAERYDDENGLGMWVDNYLAQEGDLPSCVIDFGHYIVGSVVVDVLEESAGTGCEAGMPISADQLPPGYAEHLEAERVRWESFLRDAERLILDGANDSNEIYSGDYTRVVRIGTIAIDSDGYLGHITPYGGYIGGGERSIAKSEHVPYGPEHCSIGGDGRWEILKVGDIEYGAVKHSIGVIVATEEMGVPCTLGDIILYDKVSEPTGNEQQVPNTTTPPTTVPTATGSRLIA